MPNLAVPVPDQHEDLVTTLQALGWELESLDKRPDYRYEGDDADEALAPALHLGFRRGQDRLLLTARL